MNTSAYTNTQHLKYVLALFTCLSFFRSLCAFLLTLVTFNIGLWCTVSYCRSMQPHHLALANVISWLASFSSKAFLNHIKDKSLRAQCLFKIFSLSIFISLSSSTLSAWLNSSYLCTVLTLLRDAWDEKHLFSTISEIISCTPFIKLCPVSGITRVSCIS